MKVIDLLDHDPSASVHSLPSEVSIKLTEISKVIFKSKKATLLTGAGISCNAGIPDFRSSEGLYNLVKEKYPKTVVKGQDLFDISLFRDELTLQVFCTFMEGLYASSLQAKPTETHKFIKLLKDKNKLLRCYTQNIDGIESKVNLTTGIKSSEFQTEETNRRLVNSSFNKNWKNLDVVQLHGDLNQLTCTQCFSNFEWTKKYQNMLSSGDNPECSNCFQKYQERLYSGKRLTGNIGILRPGIVLYGENHPQSEILAQGLNTDIKSRPDILIIMGTSLKVDGVKKLVKSLATSIHEKGGKVIFINKTQVSSSQWDNYVDYQVLCDCDNFIKVLKQEIPDLFLTQEQLDSKRLKQLEAKRIKQEAREEKKIQVKKDPQVLVKTPPPTPTKRKPARPVLKRRDFNSERSVKFGLKYELPSPPTSFNNDVVVTNQESDFTPNKKIKTET
ncbi:NAD-dependent deacetylase hst3 [Yamadazyma tenuis]|uniref:DHS-like NAD/FAD-binding domain-containing protein n=1 Tax=Candida tenuis (strain ATCC 10573 / BCRC 21748 / CBS 615 / JCM 9827 / NBRC 10315 / NRRL Y-1498 / VKM Y-70) TaxID=590646 RepID=G3B5F7_CANTC|nr:DHS-like NAD/FAD-binding domain-containing protein [Yamadazyma tenuis ATCC 10573]XP_006687378.1 uncharacterized protein CANTEDRAFT_114522 [Yamadazyma tenuis ATCC 10573]EGV63584.1 DHS-like NAD/FAD-binding domain-containing protein [Yamadazyma tenuis ATCC 10573]EGV63585.1 hypothetical protein CANTEDRAFT_114522 [Yamadazyma tenuis ATCC 10573]WEJ96966.1 NAD-dependent deacetylase hst3 [Yamadazyma tenuis]